MTAKTTVCAAFAVLTGVIISASAGDYYDKEATNEWFTVDASEATPSTDSKWTKPSDGDVNVDTANDRIVIDTEINDPLVYTPGGTSGEIVEVKAHIVVSPYSETPDAISGAQAALTTVTNETTESLGWYGLVRGDDGAEWVTLTGNTPTAGAEYDIMITLDNRAEQKRIRYSVKGSGDSEYTPLTSGGDPWLSNPQTDKTSISSVAFAGAGQFGDFSADKILNNSASIASVSEIPGFDFTGGSITATVSLASGNYSDKTATLTVVDFDGGTTKTFFSGTIGSDGGFSWDLADQITNLTPGGTYSYTITVKDSNDNVEATTTGTFTAANWGADGSWFSAKVVNGADVYTNGAWAATSLLPAPEITNSAAWSIYGDASFEIEDTTPGSNAVSRVDTKYLFDTFMSATSLQTLADAVSAIVAATNAGTAAWYVYPGSSGTWSALEGAASPAAETEYVLRAEFDFKSSTKRVRYQISTDDGASFTPMTLDGAQWIELAVQTKDTLSSVDISGKGVLTSIYATVADASIAKDANNVLYTSLWDAIKNGTSPFTLLTNATLAPSDITARKRFQILDNGFEFKYDNAASTKWWMYKKNDYWYLMKFGGTFIFQ